MVEASRGEGASLFPHRLQTWKCGKLPAMCVQKLVTERPSDWSPMKNELDDRLDTIGLPSRVLTNTLLHI
jgi:hypothetical protein